MRDDYLWDSSGEPDPEIQRLETALARFRHDGPAPVFSEVVPEVHRRLRWPSVLRMRFSFSLAGAAAMIMVAAGLGMLVWWSKPISAPGPGWDVARLEGAPRVGSKAVARDAKNKLRIGQALETNGESRAKIRLDEIGEVNVEPNTRLRLLRTGRGQERLALDRGTIRAYIWALPGGFVVDTPSAVAVDLGCAYTLQVDDAGAGTLRTTMGWVGFKLNGREAFIPAGAMCATRPKIGPGTPHFEDAPEPLRAALSEFDFDGGTPEQRSARLGVILTQARTRDVLTIWHLLARTNESERVRVYERLSSLVPPPSGVTRDGILRMDQKMLDLWWDALGLGDVSLWRTWERSWSQDENSGK